MSLRTVVATRYVTPLREGGSLPAIVEADDDGMYVVKFRGAAQGQGPRALVAEIVAGKPQVVLAESIANLHELRRIAAERTQAQWVWLTPVPADEERAAKPPAFRYGSSSWRNTDITALANAIRAFGDPVVDLVDVFGVPGHPELQGPDGVHPSLAGQQRIVTALVETLAA